MPDSNYKKRFRVGLLTATITDPFSGALAKGACEEAEELGCDLFIFPGKYIGIDDIYAQLDAHYEYQYNALFDIAAAAGLDYIINAVGTITYALNDEERREFLHRFKGTPMLAVAAESDEYDYLIFDNKNGIYEAVDHLADEGRKCICIMKGDPHNTECRIRYAAYRESLERRGLRFEERYALDCPISGLCDAEAEEMLKRVPELDAVICVNDSIARAVVNAVKKAGKRPGTDIAVVGFDDLPFAAELHPPLATVRADAELLGRRAVQKAMHFLCGYPDEEHYVPTKFILRNTASRLGELYNSPEAVFNGDIEEVSQNMRDYLARAKTVDEAVKEPIHGVFTRLMSLIAEKFLTAGSPAGEKELSEALYIADGFFTVGKLSADTLTKTYSIIDGGYKWCLKRCTPENIPALRRIYEHFYRSISAEMMREHRRLEQSFRDRTHVDNVFIRDTLMFGDDLSEAYSNIVRQMGCIGADTGYVFLLKEPVKYRSREIFDTSAEWEQVSYFYGGERFVIPEGERSVTLKEMFSEAHLPWNRRFTLIAADLYSNEDQYGIALLEPHDLSFFEELELIVYQLSGAVRTLRLLRQKVEMNEELHRRNKALDSLSKIDELTGLSNRRGFYEQAERLAEANKGRELIVCYADMDDLKTVNDRYGHNEGDYSLRVLAGCMRNLFGGGAVIGRMGGDEYAAVLPKGNHCIGEFRPRKDAFLAMVAKNEAKPFKVDMSLGLIECVCADGSEIRAALERADELLYAEKEQKKKNRI